MRKKQPALQTPTGLAIDEQKGTIVVAEIAPDGKSYEVYESVIGEKRAVNITNHDIRTTLLDGNAHTEQLRSVDASDDDLTILTALLPDSHNGHALSFVRTGDGRVLTVQADQNSVNDVASRIAEWLEQQRPEHLKLQPPSLVIETRTRAIARAWSISTQHGEQSPSGTVAFLVLGRNDYGLGLWSTHTGLVYETEEAFEPGGTIEDMCDHARNMFSKLIDEHTVQPLQLPPVEIAVVSAPEDRISLLLQTLEQSEDLRHLAIEQVSLNLGRSEPSILDQQTALAIGSIVPGYQVPMCDLLTSPAERVEQINQVVEEQDLAAQSSHITKAMVAALAPIVAILAIVVTLALDQKIEAGRLESRISAENEAAEKLKKDSTDYESLKANFGIFKNVLDTLIGLRQRQPATHQLLLDLNQRWPADASWYVSEVNVKGGAIEIKGKTKNEQAITTFAKSLEFSDGLFTNILTKTNAQGASTTAQAATQASQSNVIEFTINATYTPLATPGKPVSPTAQTASSPEAPKIPPAFPTPPAGPQQLPVFQPNAPGRPPVVIPTPANNTSNTGANQ
jgi:Tfp pilus assembly protein PilN